MSRLHVTATRRSRSKIPAATFQLVILACTGTIAAGHAPDPPLQEPKVVLRLKHTGCTAVSFSPAGDLIATGGSVDWLGPGQVKIWNARTGKLIHFDSQEDIMITGVSFSPDGKRLAIVGEDGDDDHFVRDIKTWKRVVSLKGATLSGEVRYSHDGQFIAATGNVYEDGTEDPSVVWSAITGRKIAALEKSKGTEEIAFTLDSKRVIGCSPEAISMWELGNGKVVYRREHRGATCLALAPDGNTFATGIDNDPSGSNSRGEITVWDTQTGQVKRTFEHESGIVSIAYSPSGAVRASSDRKGLVRLTSASSGKVLRQWRVPISERVGDEVTNLVFSRDGTRLAAIHEDTVLVWDLR